MISDTPIRLALQKSGRLSDDSEELIEACGIHASRRGQRLKSAATNFPMEILYLRDDDIPEYVSNGVADIGIVGENMVIEKSKPLTVSEKLGFSKCRLSLAAPRDFNYQGPKSLEGKTIATTYRSSLLQYLAKHKVSAEVREIQGSTELTPNIGLADAICDLVSTGSTLLAHGLTEVEVLFQSQAVFIQNQNLSDEKQRIVDELLFRMRAVLRAKDTKYILMNVPNDSLKNVIELFPGLKSPTVFPLAEEGWSSVHAVIDENDFWEKIGLLRDAGAEGILVCPIEKMIAS